MHVNAYTWCLASVWGQTYWALLLCASRACIYVFMYTYLYMYICIYIYICMYAYIHVCMHTYMYTYLYVHVYMYICMYVCTYIYIYKYMYTHTCIHEHAWEFYPASLSLGLLAFIYVWCACACMLIYACACMYSCTLVPVEVFINWCKYSPSVSCVCVHIHRVSITTGNFSMPGLCMRLHLRWFWATMPQHRKRWA